MSKGSKRRPCCIPAWLETLRWDRVINPDWSIETHKHNLKTMTLAHPEDVKWLTGEELKFLDGRA
jgi:hypothetical protein